MNERQIAVICAKFIEECSGTSIKAVQLVAAVSRVVGLVLSRFPAHLREQAFQAFITGARAEMDAACADDESRIH